MIQAAIKLGKGFTRSLRAKFTLGTVLAFLASFLFAVGVRYLFMRTFGHLPTRGELGAVDISYATLVFWGKFCFSALLECLLGNTYHLPLFPVDGDDSKFQTKIALNMNNNSGQASSNSGQASSTSLLVSPQENKQAESDFHNLGNSLMRAKENLRVAVSEHDENMKNLGESWIGGGKSKSIESNHHILQANVTCNIMGERLEVVNNILELRREAHDKMKKYHMQSNVNLRGFRYFNHQLNPNASDQKFMNDVTTRINKYKHGVRNIKPSALEE